MATVSLTVRGKKKKHILRLNSDLLESEIWAVGYVTVQWAMLENLIFAESLALAKKLGITPPPEVFKLSFKVRNGAFRVLVKRACRRKKERERFLDLSQRASSLENSRHHVAHGIWDWDFGAPEKPRASNARKPFQFEETFDKDKLVKIAERIGEICFAFAYPRGEAGFRASQMRRFSQTGALISRLGALILSGKDHSGILPPLGMIRGRSLLQCPK